MPWDNHGTLTTKLITKLITHASGDHSNVSGPFFLPTASPTQMPHSRLFFMVLTPLLSLLTLTSGACTCAPVGDWQRAVPKTRDAWNGIGMIAQKFLRTAPIPQFM